ncbi:MAG: signal recognition particle-docking protein FtsY [Desulfobacterales bacterium]
MEHEISASGNEASSEQENKIHECPVNEPVNDRNTMDEVSKDEHVEAGLLSENKTGFLKRLKKGLSKTREFLTTDIDELFLDRKKVDEALLEDLEALLITADMGVETTMTLMENIGKRAKKVNDASQLKELLKENIIGILRDMPEAPEIRLEKPHVIMVVGVNGSGKTTTIGKLAARFESQGKNTLLAAADTFRAAAIEQLGIWAERAGSEFVRGKDKADPASIAFDAVEASIARGMDILLIDTAGRLHTNVNLMEELKKIKRAIAKKMPGAPHEVLLVLDGSTGQNALSQAKQFHEAMGVTGMVLTKLDGTARGGIVVSICSSLKIPLQYIGIGEKIDDLQEFSPERFADALF